MEISSSITPLLFRNLITSIFILAEKSLSSLTQKSKALELIRCVLVSCFLFFLRLLLSLNPRSTKNESSYSAYPHLLFDTTSSRRDHKYMPAGDDSAIARALSQLLTIVNDIPVSSRKYQVVRSLAESLIHDNQREGVEALRQVNRTVLSEAFSRNISQLEAAATLEHHHHHHQQNGGGDSCGLDSVHWLSRVVRSVRSFADVVWMKRVSSSGSKSSAEKLAAELLWLAQTMAACGFAQGAVRRWASASNLAGLSISAEPRLQASLLKISGNVPASIFLLFICVHMTVILFVF